MHQAVLSEYIADIYKPVGAWKIEPNGTYAVTKDGKQMFIEYARPFHVPQLMIELVDYVNSVDIKTVTLKNAPYFYAKIHMGFAHIHPFWDGNGRIARLIANIPLLKAGLPPLVIVQEQRREYIQMLAEYQLNIGRLDLHSTVWPEDMQLKPFEYFCETMYSATKLLVDNVYLKQRKREAS